MGSTFEKCTCRANDPRAECPKHRREAKALLAWMNGRTEYSGEMKAALEEQAEFDREQQQLWNDRYDPLQGH